jgi:hypothetical protein
MQILFVDGNFPAQLLNRGFNIVGRSSRDLRPRVFGDGIWSALTSNASLRHQRDRRNRVGLQKFFREKERVPMAIDDLTPEELAKAAYANSLVLETMIVQIMIATAAISSPDNPSAAVRAMRARTEALWNSASLRDEAGPELLALMKSKSETFWNAVIMGAETMSAANTQKN